MSNIESINENISKLFKNNLATTLGWTTLAFIMFYLFGSILFGNVIAKFKNLNLTKLGSNNPGATNARRAMGNKMGFLVIILDILKVVIPFYICVIIMTYAKKSGGDHLILPLALIGSMLGQTFPIWSNFKGGKGVTVFGATLLSWNWIVGLIALAIVIILIFSTKTVSLSVLITALIIVGISYVPFFWQPGVAPNNLTVPASKNFLFPIVITLFWINVVIRHRENIKRLLMKKEKKESLNDIPLIDKQGLIKEPKVTNENDLKKKNKKNTSKKEKEKIPKSLKEKEGVSKNIKAKDNISKSIEKKEGISKVAKAKVNTSKSIKEKEIIPKKKKENVSIKSVKVKRLKTKTDLDKMRIISPDKDYKKTKNNKVIKKTELTKDTIEVNVDNGIEKMRIISPDKDYKPEKKIDNNKKSNKSTKKKINSKTKK